MTRFLQATIDDIAEALPVGVSMTPREIEKRLALHYSRGTVRAVMRQLSGEGRVIAEGDITQRRYRHAEESGLS